MRSNTNLIVRGTAYSILSAVIFGFNPLLARLVYAGGGNAAVLALYRMVIGSMLGLILHRIFEKDSVSVKGRTLLQLALCAAGYAVTPILLFSSYNYLDSGMATTIHFVYPVLVILGCVIFYREAISRLKVVCVVLCTAGILLLYTPGGGVSLLGIALSFLSGVTYAFYAVYLSKSGLQKMGAFQLMFWLNLARHGLHRPLHRSQRHIYHRYPALRLGGGGTLWHTLRYGRSAVPIRGKIYRRTKNFSVFYF